MTVSGWSYFFNVLLYSKFSLKAKKDNSVFTVVSFWMTTRRSKRKFAAPNKENCEENLRNNLAENTNVAKSQENYITQVSEEIEGRITKKLSKECSRTESRILGALLTWWVSSESTTPRPLRICSGDIPKRT